MKGIAQRRWIVLGAIGGGLILGPVGAFASSLFPGLREITPWGPYWSAFWGLVACAVGLVLGGLLGSRVPAMTRRVRIAFGAVVGAAIGGPLGGSFFLWAEVAGEDWPSGMAAFVIGAVAAGSAGAAVGGLLSARTSGSTLEAT